MATLAPKQSMLPGLPIDIKYLSEADVSALGNIYSKYKEKFKNIPTQIDFSDAGALGKYVSPEDKDQLLGIYKRYDNALAKVNSSTDQSNPLAYLQNISPKPILIAKNQANNTYPSTEKTVEGEQLIPAVPVDPMKYLQPTGGETLKDASYDVKSSGTYDVKGDQPTLIQKITPTAKKLAPALLPLGSLLANLGLIKAAENAALSGMTPVAFNTGQAPVPVVKGLASEVIAAHKAAAAGLIPKKTSDATYNAMTEQMTFANKMKAATELAALQAQDLDQQRKMQQQVLGMNAQSAAKAMNEEAAYNAQLSKEKGLIKAQADAERRNAINKIISEGLEVAARLKEEKEVKRLSVAEYEYNKIINKINAINAYEKAHPGDNTYQVELQNLMKQLNNYGSAPIAKKGTKLVQRKKCK